LKLVFLGLNFYQFSVIWGYLFWFAYPDAGAKILLALFFFFPFFIGGESLTSTLTANVI